MKGFLTIRTPLLTRKSVTVLKASTIEVIIEKTNNFPFLAGTKRIPRIAPSIIGLTKALGWSAEKLFEIVYLLQDGLQIEKYVDTVDFQVHFPG